MTDTVADLQSLLEHPGWHWFVREVEGEWGAGGRRFEGMFERIADQVGDPAQNMAQMQQVAVARREILRLMQRPAERLTELRRQEAPKPEPVRRELANALTGQSRRGGL